MEASVEDRKSTRPHSRGQHAPLVTFAALVVGLSLSICIADIFVPLFWERRWFIKLGFLIPAASLLAALVFPTITKVARRVVAAAATADRLALIFVSTVLALTAAFVIRGVWIHQAAAISLNLAGRPRPQSHLVVDLAPDFAFLITFAVFLGVAHADWINQRLNPDQRSFVSRLLPTTFAALLLGLSVSVCIADLVAPIFWEQLWYIRLACLLAVAALLAALLFSTIDKVARRLFVAAAAADRFSWLFVSTILVLTSAMVIGRAWSHQAALAAPGLSPQRTLPAADFGPEFAFLFALAIFLGMAHADSISKRLTSEQRVYFALGFLSICFLGIYFANNLLSAIDTATTFRWLNFNLAHGFNSMIPVGADFREGIYLPAQRLASGSAVYGAPNIYPPLVAVLGLPYVLFPEAAAYILHVSLLVAANLLALGLAALLAGRSSDGQSDQRTPYAYTIFLTVFVLVAFNTLTGYPFLFSLERGNIDVFAILLALASIVLLVKSPRRIWSQVLLLSIAVHLKIYPIFLFAVLLAVHGRRIVVPALLVNVAFLLVLGPGSAIFWLQSLLKLYKNYPVTFNHSAASFATLFTLDFPHFASVGPVMQIVLACLPLLTWVIAAWALIRLGGTERIAAPAFMITVPLMATLPSISFDYQLVILSSALLILLSRVLLGMTATQTRSDYLQLVAISILVLLIGRSDTLMGPTLRVLQDKYLWVLMLQLLMLTSILRQLHASRTIGRRTV